MASSRRAGTNERKWDGDSWEVGVNTFGTAGAGRDYTAISLWETDTDVDIVTATVSPVLECYNDAASYDLGGAVVFVGATVNTTYFRILRAHSTTRHLGVSGAGVVFDGSSSLSLGETDFGVEDIEVRRSVNNANPRLAVEAAATRGRIVGVLAKGVNTGAGTGLGIYNSANVTVYIVNCIAFESDDVNIGQRNGVVYNCTAVNGGGYGFSYTTTEPAYKNCIGYNNTGGDWNTAGGASGTDYNLSKDATVPASAHHVHGTLTFNNAGADDYRLTSTDTDAIGAGASLAADATFAFDDDIAFTVRS